MLESGKEFMCNHSGEVRWSVDKDSSDLSLGGAPCLQTARSPDGGVVSESDRVVK